MLAQTNAAAFEAVLQLRDHGAASSDIAHVYGAYLAALEKVILALDRHLPKAEWKRTKQAHS